MHCPNDASQVHEEFHRRGVVDWTLRPNQCVDALPRLAFSFRQVSQIALARYLLHAFTPRPLSGVWSESRPRGPPGASTCCLSWSGRRASPSSEAGCLFREWTGNEADLRGASAAPDWPDPGGGSQQGLR
jgi:hypothetical protein